MGVDIGGDRCPYFKDVVHEGYWSIVCRVLGVSFVRFVDEL
jgi:hypothetical protein